MKFIIYLLALSLTYILVVKASQTYNQFLGGSSIHFPLIAGFLLGLIAGAVGGIEIYRSLK